MPCQPQETGGGLCERKKDTSRKTRVEGRKEQWFRMIDEQFQTSSSLCFVRTVTVIFKGATCNVIVFNKWI